MKLLHKEANAQRWSVYVKKNIEALRIASTRRSASLERQKARVAKAREEANRLAAMPGKKEWKRTLFKMLLSVNAHMDGAELAEQSFSECIQKRNN